VGDVILVYVGVGERRISFSSFVLIDVKDESEAVFIADLSGCWT